MLKCSESTFPNALQANVFLRNSLGKQGGFVIFLPCLLLWPFVPQFFSFAGTEAELVLRFSLKGDIRFHRKRRKSRFRKASFSTVGGNKLA